MKEEHKRLIESIIQKLKEADGYLHSQQFVLLFNLDHKLRASITRIMIKDLNLLENVGTHGYRITKDGWNFTSFQELENSEYKLAEKEIIERENLIISTNLNKWFLKTKWLPLLLSLVAIVASTYLSIQDKNKQEKLEIQINKNKKTIEILQKEILLLKKQVKAKQ